MDFTPDDIAVQIANAQALSEEVDVLVAVAHRLVLGGWTGNQITFDVWEPAIEAWSPLYLDNAEYVVAVGADRSVVLNPAAFIGIRKFRIRSGTSAAPVNQGAARTIHVVAIDR